MVLRDSGDQRSPDPGENLRGEVFPIQQRGEGSGSREPVHRSSQEGAAAL